MGNTFFENKRKQHLKKQIEKLEAKSRHTHTYILTLLKDVQESENQLSKSISEKDFDYWERRRDNCNARIDASTKKAKNLQEKIATLNAILSQL